MGKGQKRRRRGLPLRPKSFIQSPFLHLPTEIRSQIYNFLFLDHRAYFMPRGWEALDEVKMMIGNVPRKDTSIFYVSKLCYTESRPEYFRNTSIRFEGCLWYSLKAATEYIPKALFSSLSHVRHVRLDLGLGCTDKELELTLQSMTRAESVRLADRFWVRPRTLEAAPVDGDGKISAELIDVLLKDKWLLTMDKSTPPTENELWLRKFCWWSSKVVLACWLARKHSFKLKMAYTMEFSYDQGAEGTLKQLRRTWKVEEDISNECAKLIDPDTKIDHVVSLSGRIQAVERFVQ